MSIRNKDGIKAQIASDPAIGVHAVLSLHAGDDQAGHVACLKLLQQIGACKGAWAVFFEHNLTAVQLQFGCELGAGLVLTGFHEDWQPHARFVIEKFVPTFIATRSVKL